MTTPQPQSDCPIDGPRHTPTDEEVIDGFREFQRLIEELGASSPTGGIRPPEWAVDYLRTMAAQGVSLVSRGGRPGLVISSLMVDALYLGAFASRRGWDVDPRPVHPAEDRQS